eukprot:366438-Chlamydomonas_euryale.AAC.4
MGGVRCGHGRSEVWAGARVLAWTMRAIAEARGLAWTTQVVAGAEHGGGSGRGVSNTPLRQQTREA